MATQLEDDLILAGALTPANHPEEEAAAPLKADRARQELSPIAELSIDRGSLSSPVVAALLQAGGAVICRPWGVAPGEGCSTQDFTLNLRAKTLTCPGGHTEPLRLGTVGEFPAAPCARCPLRAQCTTATPG